MRGGLAVMGEGCTRCGACVSACPVGAIDIPLELDDTNERPKAILVFAQVSGGEILDVSRALVQKAAALNANRGGTTHACLLGGGEGAQALIDCGADTVFTCDDARLSALDDGLYAELLARLIREQRPDVVLFGATDFGRSLAPRIAARLKTGLTADCTALCFDEKTGLLRQTRPAFGGNLMATIVCPNALPQMATVRPGVFAFTAPSSARAGRIIPLTIPEDAKAFYEILAQTHNPPVRGIADADIIVTAGRGVGGVKNMALVHAFAEKIGAQVALTRSLVDAGYGGAHQQIGQTGQTVSPKLLIALGVSGAIQHLAGMGGATSVVAVNTDPDAPIFGVADYAVVGDCIEVLQALLA
jgi:electron transfer flavoprotein alpha subunit